MRHSLKRFLKSSAVCVVIAVTLVYNLDILIPALTNRNAKNSITTYSYSGITKYNNTEFGLYGLTKNLIFEGFELINFKR